MYTVYQLNIPSHVYDAVGKIGHSAAMEKFPIWKLRMAVMFDDTPTQLSEEEIGFYKPVCKIVADGLSEVFGIGNAGPEEKITRLDKMRSISVGDVIVNDQTNEANIVAPYGFTKINFK